MTTMSPVPGHNDDPKKENSDDNSLGPVDTPQFISMGSSSEDEEDDEPGNHGYQLLPQDPCPDNNGDEEDVDEPNVTPVLPSQSHGEPAQESIPHTQTPQLSTQVPEHIQVPEIQNVQAEERRDVWNKTRDSKEEVFDTEQASKIRAAMAGFSLPAPTWAQQIPEEVWKAKLMAKIKDDTTTDQAGSSSKSSSKR